MNSRLLLASREEIGPRNTKSSVVTQCSCHPVGDTWPDFGSQHCLVIVFLSSDLKDLKGGGGKQGRES